MKKLTLLLMLYPSVVLSEEIKLSCDIKVVSTYSIDGSSETNQYNVIIEVFDNGRDRVILPNKDITSVSNVKHPNVLSIKDLSDSTKWDISVKTKSSKEGKEDSTSIIIDRNVGKIWTSDTFNTNDMVISTRGYGNCEKINITKKKF